MPVTTSSDLLTILDALRAEIELYLHTGMRVSAGRLVLWIHEVRLAMETPSAFVRDVIGALGRPQPPPDSTVNLSEIALQVVGQIEELKTQNTDLLAALKEARIFIAKDYPDSSRAAGNWPTVTPVIDRIDAAIAKAEA